MYCMCCSLVVFWSTNKIISSLKEHTYKVKLFRFFIVYLINVCSCVWGQHSNMVGDCSVKFTLTRWQDVMWWYVVVTTIMLSLWQTQTTGQNVSSREYWCDVRSRVRISEYQSIFQHLIGSITSALPASTHCYALNHQALIVKSENPHWDLNSFPIVNYFDSCHYSISYVSLVKL